MGHNIIKYNYDIPLLFGFTATSGVNLYLTKSYKNIFDLIVEKGAINFAIKK